MKKRNLSHLILAAFLSVSAIGAMDNEGHKESQCAYYSGYSLDGLHNSFISVEKYINGEQVYIKKSLSPEDIAQLGIGERGNLSMIDKFQEKFDNLLDTISALKFSINERENLIKRGDSTDLSKKVLEAEITSLKQILSSYEKRKKNIRQQEINYLNDTSGAPCFYIGALELFEFENKLNPKENILLETAIKEVEKRCQIRKLLDSIRDEVAIKLCDRIELIEWALENKWRKDLEKPSSVTKRKIAQTLKDFMSDKVKQYEERKEIFTEMTIDQQFETKEKFKKDSEELLNQTLSPKYIKELDEEMLKRMQSKDYWKILIKSRELMNQKENAEKQKERISKELKDAEEKVSQLEETNHALESALNAFRRIWNLNEGATLTKLQTENSMLQEMNKDLLGYWTFANKSAEEAFKGMSKLVIEILKGHKRETAFRILTAAIVSQSLLPPEGNSGHLEENSNPLGESDSE